MSAIRFRSTSVEPADGECWRVVGELTIRDVTKTVVLDTELEGRGKDYQGAEHVGFTAETSFSRAEFGLTYNTMLETGGVVVGDRVKVTLPISAVRQ